MQNCKNIKKVDAHKYGASMRVVIKILRNNTRHEKTPRHFSYKDFANYSSILGISKEICMLNYFENCLHISFHENKLLNFFNELLDQRINYFEIKH